jgi:hypothetical protein
VLLGLLETLLLGLARLLLAGRGRVVGIGVLDRLPAEHAHHTAEQTAKRPTPRAGPGKGTRECIESVGVHDKDLRSRL